MPTFFAPPSPPVELLRVHDAFLSRVDHGPLRTMNPPFRWLRGAVYDATGKLVEQSQKLGGVNGNNWVPADPGRMKPPKNAERLEGTWLYGGHWIQHFGHFIIETITTLWPEDHQVDGLVFHKYLKRPWSVDDWQSRLLEHVGYGGLPVRVADGRHALVVDELLVPSRAVVSGGWAHAEAITVWDRVRSRVGAGTSSPSRVFLSRSGHNLSVDPDSRKSRSSRERDAALDRVFSSAGFDVVRPEELAIDRQVELAAHADVLAGSSGSALHLSAFSPSSTRVIEIGDERSPDAPIALQLVVDAARGHRHAFVAHGTHVSDLPRILAELDAGQVPSGSGLESP